MKSTFVESYSLYCVTIFACLISSLARETQAATQVAPVPQLVTEACKHGLDFADLEEFRRFIEQYKLLSEEQLQQDELPSKCFEERDAILELEPLIVTERVCDTYQIDMLISYHAKYLKPRLNLFAAKPVTQKFFAKYAIQVAYVCKKNLIKNLEASSELLKGQAKSIEEAKEKVFKERPELKTNIRLIAEQAETTTNVKQKKETEMTLGEYREALTRLKRPEDVLTFERSECEKSGSRRVQVAASELNMFFKPAVICLNMAQYYSGSVLSIARLANYGYTANDPELDVTLADSALVKDWLVAVQVCEPMLHMRTEKIENDVAIIDTCSERVTSIENLAVFEDKLEGLDNEKLPTWLKTSEASRHSNQKLMKSAMKKLAKANLVRQLKQGNMKAGKILKVGFKALKGGALQMDMLSATRQMSRQLASQAIFTEALHESTKNDRKSTEDAIRALVNGLNENQSTQSALRVEDDGLDEAVSFDPVISLIATVALFAIMFTFEWLFFVVMTLAGRICHRMNFNFDHLLMFPPKVLSWKDAEFVKHSKDLEAMDEDDFFDYDELSPDEQNQRDLLMKVFGKPPPLVYRD